MESLARDPGNEIAPPPSWIDQLRARTMSRTSFRIRIQQDEQGPLDPLTIKAIREDLADECTRHSLRPTNDMHAIVPIIVLASQVLEQDPSAPHVEGVHILLNDTPFAQENPREDRKRLPSAGEVSLHLTRWQAAGHVVSEPMSRYSRAEGDDEDTNKKGPPPLLSNLVRPLDIVSLLRQAQEKL